MERPGSTYIAPPSTLIVMGVSGCGKSAIGTLLAQRLGWECIEGDDFHPPANIAKMSSGVPLTDADRQVWLLALGDVIARSRAAGGCLVLSCSALKRRYRDLLRSADPALACVHLDGERALIEQRMRARSAHWMPVALLDSQLRDLEALAADERGVRVEIGQPPAAMVAQIITSLALDGC